MLMRELMLHFVICSYHINITTSYITKVLVKTILKTVFGMSIYKLIDYIRLDYIDYFGVVCISS